MIIDHKIAFVIDGKIFSIESQENWEMVKAYCDELFDWLKAAPRFDTFIQKHAEKSGGNLSDLSDASSSDSEALVSTQRESGYVIQNHNEEIQSDSSAGAESANMEDSTPQAVNTDERRPFETPPGQRIHDYLHRALIRNPGGLFLTDLLTYMTADGWISQAARPVQSVKGVLYRYNNIYGRSDDGKWKLIHPEPRYLSQADLDNDEHAQIEPALNQLLLEG